MDLFNGEARMKRFWFAFSAFSAFSAPLAAQQGDTVRLPLLWQVIEGEHTTADSLGTLTGVALDARGNVYVSDRAESKLWVFDAAGRSQRAIGRKGEGPGEFQAPTGIAFDGAGRLYVRDLNQVSRFAVDPATNRASRFETRFAGPTMSDWMSTLASRFDASGRFFYPQFNSGNRSQRMGLWHVFDTAGAHVDSIAVPVMTGVPAGWASVRLSANGGRVLRGMHHVPFAAMPSWDVSPRGTVLYTTGREYVIREVDRAGRLVREFRRSVGATRIPTAERADSLNALRVRRDSVTVPRTQVTGVPDDVWELRLPETYPPILAIHAAPDGLLWVRRWVPNGDERSVFDVFDQNGRFQTVVEVPGNLLAEVTPVLFLDAVVGIGVDPETGAHTILRFGHRTR
jgi:hypothetical protein